MVATNFSVTSTEEPAVDDLRRRPDDHPRPADLERADRERRRCRCWSVAASPGRGRRWPAAGRSGRWRGRFRRGRLVLDSVEDHAVGAGHDVQVLNRQATAPTRAASVLPMLRRAGGRVDRPTPRRGTGGVRDGRTGTGSGAGETSRVRKERLSQRRRRRDTKGNGLVAFSPRGTEPPPPATSILVYRPAGQGRRRTSSLFEDDELNRCRRKTARPSVFRVAPKPLSEMILLENPRLRFSMRRSERRFGYTMGGFGSLLSFEYCSH